MKLAARIPEAVAPRTVLYALIPKVVSVIESDDTGSRALGFSLYMAASNAVPQVRQLQETLCTLCRLVQHD